ncbi:Lipid A 3-O-deacylase-related protein [Cellulophaga algicola DSM 14237]|uniref:Lipid A 3-O-deacylase-related protein n=1 Tax=Cellulophaga algicola (strain DSM 14237 / IC166 / ACAM 630) TaxID=688270 RepID=E6X5T0_CELAD|nr:MULTISPECIES: acyloxyacyl hydrolase [Cellulophaga]ADV49472.1 Lipid A 3-O-deacylase-related protein [Cellulophaga algicola DSM 14237]
MKFKFSIYFIFLALGCYAQKSEEDKRYTLDASQFYGSILRHNPDITHLIDSHPGGIILSLNRKTYGEEYWQQRYNYPDLGFSFIYQDYNNETLGESYAAYAHYNFYFLNRYLQFRIGQGLAYMTNPYDKETNFRNNAFGSQILSTTYLMLNFHKENIVKGIGFKAGFSVMHYSNANVKAPNTSTNTFALNVGVTYDLDGGKELTYLKTEKKKIIEPVKYNLAFRTGINESDVINSGQFPFYILSGYADKRVSDLSAIQVGGDVYFSKFLKELIKYQSIAFPENNVSADDDYKRVGVFIGHELFINKMSVISQLGYYVYYPFDFEGRVYNRIGLKRYFGDKVYGALTLKSHGAKAEAVEFGIGIRL